MSSPSDPPGHRPEAHRPDVPRPDVPRPEAGRPGVGQPAVGRPAARPTAADAVADPRVQAVGVLLTTSALLERLLGAEMERVSGITHPMFEVLLHLEAHPKGATMSALSRSLVLTSGGATRLVDRMVDAGLVHRERTSQDRRVQRVTLTPAGTAKLAEAAARHAEAIERHVVSVLPPERLAAAIASLDVLGAHAREALPPLG